MWITFRRRLHQVRIKVYIKCTYLYHVSPTFPDDVTSTTMKLYCASSAPCIYSTQGYVLYRALVCSSKRCPTYYIVSFPERFLGRTVCSISCDWHDNASFWHGNASTALTRMQYTAIGRCHMIITCNPHGMNLIGATKFQTETSSSSRKHLMYTRPFPGNETNLL